MSRPDIHGFVRHIEQKLQLAADEKALRIGRASCKSIESYKHETGKVKGLEEALGVVTSAYKDYLGRANQ